VTVTVAAPPETKTVAERPRPQPEAVKGVARGRQLYLDAGCGGCHGQYAEGTDIAPALPGHTKEQVRRQVRTPLFQMPPYPDTRLSEKDLDAIAAYITSLEPTEEHVEPVKLSNPVVSHHWLAISSIKAQDTKDAIHHVAHILDLDITAEHRAAMERATELLREGDLHEAEHLVETMLAGRAEPTLTSTKLHLQLALSALEGRDTADARHHIGHYLEDAIGEEQRKGRVIRTALRRGDLHEAEDGVRALLGLPHE